MRTMIKLTIWRAGQLARMLVNDALETAARKVDPVGPENLKLAAGVLHVVAEAAREGWPEFWHEQLDVMIRAAGGAAVLDDVADRLETEARF